MTNTVDENEIQAFSKDAGRWWDESGPFAPLHRLNPVRMGYIRTQISDHYGLDQKSLKPFKGLKILDIGCGGGLVCEPLARLGAEVTGIDADAVAIGVAAEHAVISGLTINYLNESTDSLLLSSRATSRDLSGGEQKDLSSSHKKRSSPDDTLFDAVLALEIIEHVSDPDEFVKHCARLVKPGGIVIFSTLNRTPKSFVLGIVAAEYILRWVPQGTHSWKKFVRPSELARYARGSGLTVRDLSGLACDPLKNEFRIEKTDLAVNYFLSVIQPQ